MFHSTGDSFLSGADQKLPDLTRIGSYFRCNFHQRFLTVTDHV